MPKRARVIRLLMVEDNEERVDTVKGWLPKSIETAGAEVPLTLSWAFSAGAALGQLERDRGRVYAGILLDHDLQMRAATAHDRHLSGRDVVRKLVQVIDSDVPVLVHSMNFVDSPEMERMLDAAGFTITRVPMEELTKERLGEWLLTVVEAWEEQ